MTLTLAICIAVPAFVGGFCVGSLLTVYALLDLKMRIDDARAEGWERP